MCSGPVGDGANLTRVLLSMSLDFGDANLTDSVQNCNGLFFGWPLIHLLSGTSYFPGALRRAPENSYYSDYQSLVGQSK